MFSSVTESGYKGGGETLTNQITQGTEEKGAVEYSKTDDYDGSDKNETVLASNAITGGDKKRQHQDRQDVQPREQILTKMCRQKQQKQKCWKD